jgi:hypothetical protein
VQITIEKPLPKIMIHLSSAQLFEFSAVQTAKDANVRSTQLPLLAPLRACLNMFDFSPTVVSHPALMQGLLCMAGGQVIMNRTLPGGRMS